MMRLRLPELPRRKRSKEMCFYLTKMPANTSKQRVLSRMRSADEIDELANNYGEARIEDLTKAFIQRYISNKPIKKSRCEN